MTPQEIKWKDKIVVVTGIKSNNGVLHSSALVAIEVVRKFGKENVILLNHDIAAS